jgi:glycosyltransferase involved in cell wall biosynthesis
MKYPNVIFFRKDEYDIIDSFFNKNKEKLLCTLNITSVLDELNKLNDSNYHLIVTYGDSNIYLKDVNNILSNRIKKRWLHFNEINDINQFNKSINYCFINNVLKTNRVKFSIFTTCYNSYDKILRAYNSIKNQTFKDWEWVILDDSPDDNHFTFLKNLFINDKRVRLYKRSENSGNIGNVKNEVVSLCRGEYLLELDHDDEILPDVLNDSVNVFESNHEIGFIYMDYTNITEDGKMVKYSDFFSFGYAGYYCYKYNNKWYYVASTPNINNITLSHIISVPNHPRIWRKDILLKIGNFSEFLPICDDYELILRTAINTKMAKIHKLGYIQYMNNNNNNFSLIRNSEINRLCQDEIYPQYYDLLNINKKMQNLDAFEDFSVLGKEIWKRDNYEHKYCNKIININYETQYCILGVETLLINEKYIMELYKNDKNDFILLENEKTNIELMNLLDEKKLDRIKCYSLINNSIDDLISYFKLIYKSCDEYVILLNDKISTNISIKINQLVKNKNAKKITIITPSIRPENLSQIKDSINFDYINEWIIVYDENIIKENPYLFKNESKITEYLHKNEKSTAGNSQRNFALSNIKNKDTYIYFLDDDNIMHPEIYNLFDCLEDNKIYSFNQKRPANIFPFKDVLKGNNIEVYKIDSAMFLIDYNLCKNIEWSIEKYNADGLYIVDCYNSNKDAWIFINNILAYYNILSK